MRKIIILEDDEKLANSICQFLETEGFACSIVGDGRQFAEQLKKHECDLYLLDINVPRYNGLKVCEEIRRWAKQIPILMLSAYIDVDTKIKALNAGADDYLVKPFHLEELLARIRALLRRTATDPGTTVYKLADLVVDTVEKKVWRKNKLIPLTPKEYKLLELLIKADGATISKQRISEEVWDLNFETGTNTIEVYISFLRNKVDKGFSKPLIHTRPGFGYYLKEEK